MSIHCTPYLWSSDSNRYTREGRIITHQFRHTSDEQYRAYINAYIEIYQDCTEMLKKERNLQTRNTTVSRVPCIYSSSCDMCCESVMYSHIIVIINKISSLLSFSHIYIYVCVCRYTRISNPHAPFLQRSINFAFFFICSYFFSVLHSSDCQHTKLLSFSLYLI